MADQVERVRLMLASRGYPMLSAALDSGFTRGRAGCSGDIAGNNNMTSRTLRQN